MVVHGEFHNVIQAAAGEFQGDKVADNVGSVDPELLLVGVLIQKLTVSEVWLGSRYCLTTSWTVSSGLSAVINCSGERWKRSRSRHWDDTPAHGAGIIDLALIVVLHESYRMLGKDSVWQGKRVEAHSTEPPIGLQ